MIRKIYVLGWIGLLGLVLTAGGVWGKTGSTDMPDPESIDRITHDFGNIVTTIDNWGYIGGYPGLYPAGEWPRNSGHDYLAEIKYWMGAVTPTGDTIVANTDEDFRPIPSFIQAEETYNIRLSTNPDRYNYNPDDTTGQWLGNPALGWRVYNADSAAWVYNRIYNPADSLFYPGGPTALQQSFYRFEDGNAPNALGLQMTHTVCQWNYCYNEDILFVILEITNVSGVDYSEFAFGLYCDFDVGGPNSQGGNGRLGDLVAFDQAENLAWTYDEDGFDPGWGAMVRTGLMGTKYLETPDDIGMTAFRTGMWDLLPDEDPGRFELINSTQFDTSLPPTDQYYIQCTRGIDLTAGKTVRVVFALVAGQDEEEFLANAATAQTLYDNYYVGPQPPATPSLSARVGDHKVYLHWNDTAEVDVDPLSGVVDFRGYKLYRSTNLGYTWGFEARVVPGSCLDQDYIPIAAYQVDNPGDIIAHSYIDSNLTNGIEYWYCLVAFDAGDSAVPISALQNGFGRPDANVNVVRVIPRSDPAGFYNALSSVEHTNTIDGPLSDGEIFPYIFDPSEALDDEYYVTFNEDDIATTWNLIRVDEATDDTTYVLQDQSNYSGDPDTYDIVEGVRLVVSNVELPRPRATVQTGFAVPGDTTLHEGFNYGCVAEAMGWPAEYWCADRHVRSTYELRFTDGGSTCFSWWDGATPIAVPFEIWNTTFNQQVYAEIYDRNANNIWEPADKDYLIIINWPYDGSPHGEAFPYYYSWFFRIDTLDLNYATGDVLTVEGAPVNGPEDVFAFKVDDVDPSQVNASLKEIRVVPDPYFGRAAWESSIYEHKLQFVNLPEICTIRIYSLTGDLVNTIDHAGSGSADWDMLTRDGLAIASGVYIYHVESDFGSYIGRFAVIM